MNTAVKRISVLNYFGGKSRYLDFLLPLFPDHRHYIEPFCGSAVVFLNKKPSPIETISDKDERLYNFFHVLREFPEELVQSLRFTAYSRVEFQKAAKPSSNPIENARRFFIRSQMSFAGICDTDRRKDSWRSNRKESRMGMALDVAKFISKVEGLQHSIDRFRSAQIENRDFRQIIPAHSRADFFLFVDPPYLVSTRTNGGRKDYKHELSAEDHKELAEMLNETESQVMICHYDCQEYDQLYPAPKWKKILAPDRSTNLGKTKKQREAVWINYKPTAQLEIFTEK